MWSSRLFWRLFLAYGALYVALSLSFVLLESQRHEAVFRNHARQRLHDTAVVLRSRIAGDLRTGSRDVLQQRIGALGQDTQLRLTIVAEDGEVIADSRKDPRLMENHRNRPELVAAASEGIGESVRTSSTFGIPMMYYAVDVRDQGKLVALVRVSVGGATLQQQIWEARRFLWLIAACVGLVAAPLSYFVVGRIVRPLGRITASARAIAAGDYDHPVRVHSRDEIGDLGAAFRRMQEELTSRIKQLQDYAERLAAVLGGMVEGVLAVDSGKRVLLANDACRSLLGIPSSDVVGLPLSDVTRNLDIHLAVSEAMDVQVPVEREAVASGPPRRTLHLLATCLPGEPSGGCVVVLHDVTDLRRLENMRRDFVANVSHELKTPLASIKAYAETLRLGAVNDPEHNAEFVMRIEEQAQRLNQLIVDLLHLSRVESGKQAFEFTSVSVAEAVERTARQHAEVAATNDVLLEIDSRCEDAVVWADRQGVRTLLDNLVDNAIKYTAPGGRVRVKWRTAQQRVVLEVEDTGIGIAEEDQQRIFERFYRIDKARSRQLGGTGLGLAIVKHLAQAFGGDVGLASQPGAGSTFRVRLPLAPKANAED